MVDDDAYLGYLDGLEYHELRGWELPRREKALPACVF